MMIMLSMVKLWGSVMIIRTSVLDTKCSGY